MEASVTYTMDGFGEKPKKGQITKNLKILNNEPYVFDDHPFLHSFFINDSFSEITFYFKEGLNPEDYIKELGDELETICFNIITRTEIQTFCPVCTIKMINGEKIYLNDHMPFSESLHMIESEEASIFYSKLVDSDLKLSQNKVAYKELFFILHNPNRVVQFIGLYDVLAGLVQHGDTFSQLHMHNFFGRNKERYPFITFTTKTENSRGPEDSFTKLRNDIAHSKRVGIEEYLKIANNIPYQTIQQILLVISDILSGNVTP